MKILYLLLLVLSSLAGISMPAEAESRHRNDDKNTVLIFVSFSMPKESMLATLRDAQKIDAPVLLRGLVDNSFKATLLRIKAITQESGGGGLSIDPLAFERYGITQVPTVLALNQANPSLTPSFDRLSGDIPLLAALKIVRDKGTANPLLTRAITQLGDVHVQ